jgi:hypothetical protein
MGMPVSGKGVKAMCEVANWETQCMADIRDELTRIRRLMEASDPVAKQIVDLEDRAREKRAAALRAQRQAVIDAERQRIEANPERFVGRST